MAKLILKKFQCLETTSGAGSDSPYFLICLGSRNPFDADVVRIRLGPWHDEVDSGETWPVSATVASDYDLALVLCAAIEEDGDGADIAGNGELETRMKAHFRGLTNEGQSPVTDFVVREMRKKFRDAITNRLINDDLIEVKHVGVSNGPGELTLPFNGDGGRYSVTFTVQ